MEVDDLPDEIRGIVEKTVAGADEVEAMFHDDRAQRAPLYVVWAIRGDRLIRMSFVQEGDGFREGTESYPLGDVGKVEIWEGHGTVYIRGPEGEFSIGLPGTIARALMARG